MFNLNYNYNKFVYGNEAKNMSCQTHTDPIKKLLTKTASSFFMFAKSYCNFSINILLTMPGFAFPWVAFIICPTRKPRAFFLPALKSAMD